LIFSVKTEWPVALDSPDTLAPWGIFRDNTKSDNFFQDIENFFKRKITYLDCGIAGGKLVTQAIESGHNACGLEGSNYWCDKLDQDCDQARQWKQYYGKNFFTCDISRPFEIVDENNTIVQFDVITAWEVCEHLKTERLNIFIENIKKHLKSEGIFVGSISMNNDGSSGCELHQSIFSQEKWYTIFQKYFEIEENNKFARVREENNSFHILMKNKCQ